MGPLTASLPWMDTGLDGVRKWLDRVYRLFTADDITITNDIKDISNELDAAYHVFIKHVNTDLDTLGFNVAISQMMIYINKCFTSKILYRPHLEGFVIVLSCFAPHLAEELWQVILKNKNSVYLQTWPKHDDSKTIEDVITLPIQENGKLRCTIQINKDTTEAEVIQLAMSENKVQNFINGRSIKKTIYVKNKILNFIV
jgi:leucyl-tRNA synthetase